MVNTILARRVNHIVAKGGNPVWPKGSKSRGFSTGRGGSRSPAEGIRGVPRQCAGDASHQLISCGGADERRHGSARHSKQAGTNGEKNTHSFGCNQRSPASRPIFAERAPPEEILFPQGGRHRAYRRWFTTSQSTTFQKFSMYFGRAFCVSK